MHFLAAASVSPGRWVGPGVALSGLIQHHAQPARALLTACLFLRPTCYLGCFSRPGESPLVPCSRKFPQAAPAPPARCHTPSPPPHHPLVGLGLPEVLPLREVTPGRESGTSVYRKGHFPSSVLKGRGGVRGQAGKPKSLAPRRT